MSVLQQPRITPDEYLQAERKAEFRSEYYGGSMYARSGGSPRHSSIGLNIGAELRQRLRGSECKAAGSDLSVCVAKSRFYAYPDVVVYCGKPEFPERRNDVLLNPKLLIEVLSPSTEAYDRGFKSQQYRAIPSLEEYALISQHEARVEIQTRAPDGAWVLHEWTGIGAECRFDSINCCVPLAEIYLGIEFDGTIQITG